MRPPAPRPLSAVASVPTVAPRRGPGWSPRPGAAWLALLLLLPPGPLCAQNVIVDHGEIYRPTATGRVPYPPEYTGFDITLHFAKGCDPFPGGHFADLRIVCRHPAADPVEHSPAVIVPSGGPPGFWTALKKGQIYDFYWLHPPGARTRFASWAVPAEAPRCLRLDLTLDARGNAVDYAPAIYLPAMPPVAPATHVIAPAPRPVPRPAASAIPPGHGIAGKYFGQAAGGVFHYWDFNPDGTFLHRWIGGGALGHSGDSERGTFVLTGSDLVLKIARSATSFSQASVTHPGGTVNGAGASEQPAERHIMVQLPVDAVAGGVVLKLEGVPLKVRHD